MIESPQVIGRAKTVLVSSSGKAVISQIVVRRIKQQAGSKRLCFVGNVRFSGPVQRHMENIILPIIDRIVDRLGLNRKNYEISVLNLGAASAIAEVLGDRRQAEALLRQAFSEGFPHDRIWLNWYGLASLGLYEP